ncbi:MAG: penicillin acylase family protein [Ferruginibacter sp.]
MRLFAGIFTALITLALVFILNTTWLTPVALGSFLSPQHGFWQNAEPVDYDYSGNLSFPNLAGKTTVYLDERLVPHIFAEQENDAYFVQGYLHAKFRLWQMDLQTRFAAGRASEFAGKKALEHDREFRRLGMVYAAENSLREIENDPVTKSACDAYTAGVNSYIETLTASTLPLEYKLMNFRPEKWSNLRTALFIKNMAYELSSSEHDVEMTNARDYFSREDFDLLYPSAQDSMDPIISKGTIYGTLTNPFKIPADADSLYFKDSLHIIDNKPDRNNGSNNWAVSGSRTATGYPILCNDPHLGLNLPSLWFEIQIHTPTYNAYGVSFPGAPGVVIGFNDNCAWGFTNGGRDVRDYYEIQFRDESRQEYWFAGKWLKTDFRIERIPVAGTADFLDTVAYTVIGPVMYDKNFGGKVKGNTRNLAVRWKAHDPSNEFKSLLGMDAAKNYQDYLKAANNFSSPGQNIVFADKDGDIALRTQGAWPAKWKGQGDFVMPGRDSTYLWQYLIPDSSTPFQYNPERGFVSSANQPPADATYPYYLGRDYPIYRGYIINRMLSSMQRVTVDDMKKMQTDNYNVFAEMARPIFIKYLNRGQLSDEGKAYYDMLTSWNLRNDITEKGATVFDFAWKSLQKNVYADELATAPVPTMQPYESTLQQALTRDSTYKFIDDINTPAKETIEDIVMRAFNAAVPALDSLQKINRLAWGLYKDTRVNHLAKLDAFSRLHLPIGGGTHSINATKEKHGPSWRMIVSLTPETEAYGVYPGGQSGNPGSRFYDNFVNTWVAGEYYTLNIMKQEDRKSLHAKWTLNFSK